MQVRFQGRRHPALIDLQRVDTAEYVAVLDGWTFGAGPQPTVRLLFADGSGIDLKEPSKTKRITARLVEHDRRRGAPD